MSLIRNIEYSCLGFNRYMVECEFGFKGGNILEPSVLIDTWWNVNLFHNISIPRCNKF